MVRRKNLTRICFKIFRQAWKLEPEEWNKVLNCVDAMYVNFKTLEHQLNQKECQDEIDKIDAILESDNKC